MSKQTMGEFLALLRRANGFTQQEVADKLNISNRTLSSWETDRTTPDILLLPAIADLYDVTVDELLRCERTTNDTDGRLSEAALRSQRKHRFGRYSAKCLLLSGLGCFGAVLLALAFVFILYTSCPLWLFILLVVFAACDMVACTTVLFYCLYNTRLAEGLVLKEDYTEENKAYALALKNKTQKFFLVCALPLIVFAVIIIIVFFAVQPQDYEILGVIFEARKGYYIAMGVCGGLGVILFASYFIYANAGFKHLANETQIKKHNYNLKLVGKSIGFGAIPFAVYIVLIIILSLCLSSRTTSIYKTDSPEDFKKYMQTLTVSDTAAEICGIEAGDYFLDIPEFIEVDQNYDLGNGFKCSFIPRPNFIDHIEVIYILSEYENGYSCYSFGEFSYSLTDYDPTQNAYSGRIWNLRDNTEYEHSSYYFGAGIIYRVDHFTSNDGVFYEYLKSEDYDFSTFAAWIIGIATASAVVIATTLYCVKRKKQNYEF